MLQHEKNENANCINKYLHSRRYRVVKQLLMKKYGDKPIRILEIGVGFGRLFEELNSQLNIDYTGVEVLDDFYQEAKQRLAVFQNCRLTKGSILDPGLQSNLESSYDVIIALETFEHINVHDIPQAMGFLRNKVQFSYFISSVPVELGFAILVKNLGSRLLHYGRYREYTLKETINAALLRVHKITPHSSDKVYPGHKGFDWRVFRYLLHQNFEIVQIIKLPFAWLPAYFSTNILFVTKPR